MKPLSEMEIGQLESHLEKLRAKIELLLPAEHAEKRLAEMFLRAKKAERNPELRYQGLKGWEAISAVFDDAGNRYLTPPEAHDLLVAGGYPSNKNARGSLGDLIRYYAVDLGGRLLVRKGRAYRKATPVNPDV